MENSNTTNTSNIPEGVFIKRFNNRQLRTFVIPAAIGGLMLLGSLPLKFFGVVFIFFTLYVFRKYKDRTVVDVYEDFIVIYNEDDTTSIVYWDDIVMWDLNVGGALEDSIKIEVKNDQFYTILMFGVARVAVYFRKYVADKNRHEMFKAKENAKGSSFKLPSRFRRKG